MEYLPESPQFGVFGEDKIPKIDIIITASMVKEAISYGCVCELHIDTDPSVRKKPGMTDSRP